MNREVHVRFWERAEVKFLRATRQNEKPRFSALCQLPPAADVAPRMLTAALCQSTKSLRDSCGEWRALSDIHRGERVSSGGSGLS